MTEPAVARHGRFPLVDGLRAVAALGVVAVHAALFSSLLAGDAPLRGLAAHLDVGVPIFFALSGFLLHRPFLAARVLGARRVGVGRYARRRALRILPAHWAALLVLGAVLGLGGVFESTWWVHFGLMQDWGFVPASSRCVADPFRCGNGPTWTLGIEVLFYVALPLYAAALGLLCRLAPRRWAAVELGALAALAAFSFLVQAGEVRYSALLFFSPLGRAWWFAVGMGLAVLSVRAEEVGRRPAALRALADRPAATVALALALYAVPALAFQTPRPLGNFPTSGETGQYVANYGLAGLVAGLLLVPVAFAGPSRALPARVLGHPVARFLGAISYGIFLWHYPVAVALARWSVFADVHVARFWVLLAATLAVAVPCAWASYRLLERPLMRLDVGRRRAAPLDDRAAP